jgi:hypothetical protein
MLDFAHCFCARPHDEESARSASVQLLHMKMSAMSELIPFVGLRSIEEIRTIAMNALGGEYTPKLLPPTPHLQVTALVTESTLVPS